MNLFVIKFDFKFAHIIVAVSWLLSSISPENPKTSKNILLNSFLNCSFKVNPYYECNMVCMIEI